MNLVNHRTSSLLRSNGRFGAGGRVAPEPQPGREIWMTGRGPENSQGGKETTALIALLRFLQMFFFSDGDDIILRISQLGANLFVMSDSFVP